MARTFDNGQMEPVKDLVTRLRLARNLTQQQLADAAGLAQASIANIERGKTRQIKHNTLVSLAAALHTTPEYILHVAASATEDAERLAELVAAWGKLPATLRDTLLQTARGLLKAAGH